MVSFQTAMVRALVAAAFLLVLAAPARAAPANDDFAAAATLTGSPVTTSADNTAATEEPGEPEHTPDAGEWGNTSVWYNWTAPSTTAVAVDTIGSSFDTMLGVWTGSAVGALTSVGRNDDFGSGMDSRVVFQATAGTTYRIAVDGYAGATGAFVLRIGYGHANDTFASALTLNGPNGRWTWDNLHATKQTGEPNHAGNAGGASVWFRIVPSTSGTLWFDTMSYPTTLDTLLGVYTGSSVSTLTTVASNHDFAAGEVRSRLSFAATAGTTYFVAVDGASAAQARFQLRWGSYTANNDNFASAVVLSGASTSHTGFLTQMFTKEVGEPVIWNGDSSAWYSWTAPATGRVAFDTVGSTPAAGFDTVLAAYTGSAVNGLTEVARNDDHCKPGSFGLQSQVHFNATAGTTYRIMVDGYGGSWGTVTMRVRQGPPANDSFSSPTNLVGGTVSSACDNNIGATEESGEPEHTPDTGEWGANSVWYTWTATASGTASVNTIAPQTDYDTMLGVYTGTAVNALTILARNDDASGAQSRLTFPAVSGTTYRIAVDGWQNSMGNFVVTVNPPPPNPSPVNDGSTTGTDAVWSTSGTSLSANWTAVTSEPVTSYDWCVVQGAASTTCTGAAQSGTTTSASVTATGTFADGTWFTCVRSRTDFAVNGAYQCSNGVTVDTTLAAPATVGDGTTGDADTTTSTTTLSGNWSSVTDTGSGLARYDYCISTAVTCAGTVVRTWTSAGTATSITDGSLALTQGQTYYFCVRAVDAAGNQASSCSDGITVATTPTVTGTTPSSGAQGRTGLAVQVNGTQFLSGATVAFSGTGITVTSTTWVSSTRIDVSIDIASGASIGARDVTVTNPGPASGTGTGVFSVVANDTQLDVSGCPAAARTLGTALPGTASVVHGCAIGFGSSNNTSMLRLYQGDGTGNALTSGSNEVPDYSAGVADWSSSMFGGCLASTTNASAAWTVAASCPMTDGSHWNPIAATAAGSTARVATAAAGVTSASASLSFGVRTAASQGAGSYTANLVAEVVAPVV